MNSGTLDDIVIQKVTSMQRCVARSRESRKRVKLGSGFVTCILRADDIIQTALTRPMLEFFEMMAVCNLLAVEIPISCATMWIFQGTWQKRDGPLGPRGSRRSRAPSAAGESWRIAYPVSSYTPR